MVYTSEDPILTHQVWLPLQLTLINKYTLAGNTLSFTCTVHYCTAQY